MSIQSAKDFLVKISIDDEAAEKAKAAHEAALLSLAQTMGYSFSESDLREALADVEALDELADSQLGQVAGGAIRRRLMDS